MKYKIMCVHYNPHCHGRYKGCSLNKLNCRPGTCKEYKESVNLIDMGFGC